ncbi:MAG: hypothetical protein ABJG55_02045 [Paracoccaceae bacterium]
MRVMLGLIAALVAAVLMFGSSDLSRIANWPVGAQRDFQNQMAGAIRALKSSDIFAYFTLLGATAAYGFVHALGPGHGKYLIGGGVCFCPQACQLGHRCEPDTKPVGHRFGVWWVLVD